MAIRLFSSILILLAILSGAVLAQTPGPSTPPAKNPFGAGAPTTERGLTGGRAAAPVSDPSGPVDRAWQWIMAKQAEINRALAQAVLRLKTEGLLVSTAVLASLSFAYGVLHAAGPGHGKAIISSYVLANERTVRRGIYLSFLAALIQALSAIAIVGVLAIAMKATGLEIKRAEAWLETLSWGLVAAVGAWLLYRQISRLLTPKAAHAAVGTHHGHGSEAVRGHDHSHGHVHTAACGHAHHDHGHQHGHGHAGEAHRHSHHYHHDHAHGEACCDHAHLPDPRQLEGDLSWRKALAIATAVGIRPCTGAIVVLIFAFGQGLLWAGIFATFAMALGTAITVSTLAALAVGSRQLAERIGGAGSSWNSAVGAIAGVGGSALVMLLGVAFFISSLNGSGPL